MAREVLELRQQSKNFMGKPSFIGQKHFLAVNVFFEKK